MDIVVLYVEGCPNISRVDAELRGLLGDLGVDAAIEHRLVTSAEGAERSGFAGSPTILVDGRDPFPGEPTAALSCRVYDTPGGPAGVPDRTALRAAVLDALSGEPPH